MDVTLVLPPTLRRSLILAGLAAVLALGCNSGPMSADIVIEEPSCVEGALSMTFTVTSSNTVALANYVIGSAHVIGTPAIIQGANSFDVIAALNPTAINDVVTMKFSAIVSMNGALSVSNVQFYTVPPAQIPEIPECPPTHGPVIGTDDLPGLGAVLTIANPSPVPIMLNTLQIAEATVVLPPQLLEWGYFDSGTIPYVNAVPSMTLLLSGSPPIIVDLPDAPSPGTQATLMRYDATYGGANHRVIVQGDLVSGPVRTQMTTWGAVKALYKQD